ncbi:MAG: mechanosensitive ion channel family protein [Bacteroidota bacterium]
MIALLCFALFYLLAQQLSVSLKRKLTAQMDDPLLAQFLGRFAKLFLLGIAFMICLKIMGWGDVAAGLLTGASVSALLIGFAFKDIGENFLAGIMMAFNRPFQLGDVVEINGHTGKVHELNLRNSLIKSFDGRDIFIPNSTIVKSPVINHTRDGFRRYEFELGLDYEADTQKAIRICTEMLKSVSGVLEGDKAPSAYITDVGSRTLQITAYFWVNTLDKRVNATAIKSEAIDKILALLGKHGIYLPGEIVELKNYPNQSLHMHTQMPYGS